MVLKTIRRLSSSVAATKTDDRTIDLAAPCVMHLSDVTSNSHVSLHLVSVKCSVYGYSGDSRQTLKITARRENNILFLKHA